MEILLCGNPDNCIEFLNQCENRSEFTMSFCYSEEELRKLIGYDGYESVVVLLDGADGMEAVITAKRQRPELPVIWFSNDKGFATQSYRLQTAYFHEKPITPQLLKKAFSNCRQCV